MPGYGFMGKIAYVNLTTREIKIIDSEPYEKWVGGHGLATALFWDYIEDFSIDALDPKNLIVVAADPFSGTMVPTAGGRAEVTGIGAYSPTEWYNRSAIGGRIAGSMKRSGFDAFMVTGKADHPVWINVYDGEVTIEDASDLWGKDCWETQEEIWRRVTNNAQPDDWYNIKKPRGERTIMRPSVMAISPLGENLGRISGIVHDAGHIAAYNGFGAVWGSKNLKAVSFHGTKSVAIAHPSDLIKMRAEYVRKNSYNIDDPVAEPADSTQSWDSHVLVSPGKGFVFGDAGYIPHGPESCEGCHIPGCRSMFPDTLGNQLFCSAGIWGMADGTDGRRKGADLINRFGINAFPTDTLSYIYDLYKRGIAGPGKQIDTGEFDFSDYDHHSYVRRLCEALIKREEPWADALADGTMRAAMKWGTAKEDLKTGALKLPQYGYYYHYNPYVETDWSFGSLLTERDTNQHNYNYGVYWMPNSARIQHQEPLSTAEEITSYLAKETGLDQRSFDYSEENCYSDYRVDAVAWSLNYSRFWMDSMNICDMVFNCFNYQDPDVTDGNYYFDMGYYLTKLYTAVTGIDMSWEESVDMGHKFLILDRAIWAMQGRHRDQEVFADFVYDAPNTDPAWFPMIKDGEWTYSDGLGRTLDREKVEDFKTQFYIHEGLDPKTGWPTRSTLEKYGMKNVADRLEAAGKLGAEIG